MPRITLPLAPAMNRGTPGRPPGGQHVRGERGQAVRRRSPSRSRAPRAISPESSSCRHTTPPSAAAGPQRGHGVDLHRVAGMPSMRPGIHAVAVPGPAGRSLPAACPRICGRDGEEPPRAAPRTRATSSKRERSDPDISKRHAAIMQRAARLPLRPGVLGVPSQMRDGRIGAVDLTCLSFRPRPDVSHLNPSRSGSRRPSCACPPRVARARRAQPAPLQPRPGHGPCGGAGARSGPSWRRLARAAWCARVGGSGPAVARLSAAGPLPNELVTSTPATVAVARRRPSRRPRRGAGRWRLPGSRWTTLSWRPTPPLSPRTGGRGRPDHRGAPCCAHVL